MNKRKKVYNLLVAYASKLQRGNYQKDKKFLDTLTKLINKLQDIELSIEL